MNINKLANVIFTNGSKIHENHYKAICESIETNRFTLDTVVSAYKNNDVSGKNLYILEDNTTVLVSNELIEQLNLIDVDKSLLEAYMKKSYSNFRSIVGLFYVNK